MITLVFLTESRVLWNNLNTHIEVILLSDNPQHNLSCMSVVFIFRKTAQRVVDELLVAVSVQSSEHHIPLAVVGAQVRHIIATRRVGISPEVVGGTVALRVAILEVVAELEECGFEDRFTIGQAYVVIIALLRSHIIAVALIGRVTRQQLIEGHHAS